MSELSASKKRLEYVDFIRGLAMLTIIFVHTNLCAILPNWTQYFYSFQIFVFFFISGYLLKKSAVEENYLKWLEKQAWHLLLPYVIFALINNFLNATFYGIERPALIVNFFNANLYFGAIWFLPALFLCCVVAGYIVKICKKDALAVLLAVIVMMCGILVADCIGSFLRIPQALVGVFFYVAGHIFRKYEERVWNALKLKWCYAIGIIAVLGGLFIAMLNDTVYASRMEMGILPLTLLGALLTICGFFIVFRAFPFKKDPVSRCIAYIGKNSLAVVCTHCLVIFFVYEAYAGEMARYSLWSLVNILINILALVTQFFVLILWNAIKAKIRDLKPCQSNTQ